MPVSALLTTAFGIGLDQLVHWRFGTAGTVALLLLTFGIKARNATCAGIGAAVLALLVTRLGHG
ncbi:hypothetical protein AB0P17_22760 [Streptomyces sp. NPDC088124]|uniref:hypothetical protein n=1 Tax=Streptomyces sp. NPDC088124 TaxID=3154654 RepID=UPI00341C3A13